MKKFRIKDEDGMEYQVEEIEKKEVPTEDEVSVLSEDEIASLKKLAAVADKLVALTETTDEVEEEVKESVNEVLEDEDEDEIIEDEDKEEIVDTDEETEKGSMHDSVNSLSKSKIDDSIDAQCEIADYWSKRYNGGNR